MLSTSRRRFLASVGRGMFVASIGPSLAFDMKLASAYDAEGNDRVTFGAQESLVDLLQSTPVDKMLPLVVEKFKQGTTLHDFTAAAALANGRAFAGEDYIGFHTLMALRPALTMAEELSSTQAALPVLKVLYRNSARIQEAGVNTSDALKPVAADSSTSDLALRIRDAVRMGDRETAERLLAGSAAASPKQAFDDLLETVEEGAEVHRIVLASRAWDMIALVGEENAAAMLRQSLRYCLKNEPHSAKNFADVRALLPRVMDQFHLDDQAWGTKTVDDAWVDEMTRTLWTSSPEQAAEAVAAALAEGICPPRIFEAISLATNQLVLCDEGRPKEWAQPNKPIGSVHGDSIGVHASDTAHAWRMIALNAGRRHSNAAIVLAAWNAAKDRTHRAAEFATWQPRPWPEQLEQVASNDPRKLLAELRAAIESGDQNVACAVTAKYGQVGGDEHAVFDLLRGYATSEDGALHAEKYYLTVKDNFRMTSAPQRWKHVIGLARVSASEYGRPAPGYAEAKGLLGLA